MTAMYTVIYDTLLSCIFNVFLCFVMFVGQEPSIQSICAVMDAVGKVGDYKSVRKFILNIILWHSFTIFQKKSIKNCF